MDSTLFSEKCQGETPIGIKELPTFYQICQQVEDSRKARGKRYDLAGLLVILLAARMAGMKSILAVCEWAKDQEEEIRGALNLSWKRMPCANTYSQALAR